MKNTILIKSLLIAASLPLFVGCVERQVVYRDRPVSLPPDAKVVMDQPGEPPPPQVEIIPAAPDPTFIWIGGSWEWRGRWIWALGHWERPYPGHFWVRGGWVKSANGHIWVEGHWR